jgi:hypothetical protein
MILASSEFRPTSELRHGHWSHTSLWDPLGDYTSNPQIRIHGHLEREWRAGAFHLVRFTLTADELFTWNEIVQESNWTPEEVAALIRNDQMRHGATDYKNWSLRHDPVPLSQVLKVETTSFEDAD